MDPPPRQPSCQPLCPLLTNKFSFHFFSRTDRQTMSKCILGGLIYGSQVPQPLLFVEPLLYLSSQLGNLTRYLPAVKEAKYIILVQSLHPSGTWIWGMGRPYFNLPFIPLQITVVAVLKRLCQPPTELLLMATLLWWIVFWQHNLIQDSSFVFFSLLGGELNIRFLIGPLPSSVFWHDWFDRWDAIRDHNKSIHSFWWMRFWECTNINIYMRELTTKYSFALFHISRLYVIIAFVQVTASRGAMSED